MRFERLRLERGMELAAEEPGMVGSFDDFDVIFVGSAARDAEARGDESFFVIAVELVAVAVALAVFKLAVSAIRERARLKFARPCTQTHGAGPFVDAEEFAQFVNDAVRRLRVAFGCVGAFEAGGGSR